MDLQTTISIFGYGTSEGVKKAWDVRGRKSFGYDELSESHYQTKDAKTGSPISFGAFHNSVHPVFKYRERDGVFFAPDVTAEFGDHAYHATLNFKNPLVAKDGVEAAKALGEKGLAKQYENLSSGVDEHDEPLVGDTYRELWQKADAEMATAARAAGHDGILYSDQDGLTPIQYQVLDKAVLENVRHIGKFNQDTMKYER